jgi:hypothetical protein
MSYEPTQAERIVEQIRLMERDPDNSRILLYVLDAPTAAAIIDAALAAEYMRGVIEASGACPTCGATKTEQCHCGEDTGEMSWIEANL